MTGKRTIPNVSKDDRAKLDDNTIKEFNRVLESVDIAQLVNSSCSNNLPDMLKFIKEQKKKQEIERKESFRLFFTGFLQVFFVAINTYFITQQLFIGVFIVSFLISFIWSFNVRKVVFGNLKDRIIYSLGASIGGLSGLLLATQYSKISYLLSLI